MEKTTLLLARISLFLSISIFLPMANLVAENCPDCECGYDESEEEIFASSYSTDPAENGGNIAKDENGNPILDNNNNPVAPDAHSKPLSCLGEGSGIPTAASGTGSNYSPLGENGYIDDPTNPDGPQNPKTTICIIGPTNPDKDVPYDENNPNGDDEYKRYSKDYNEGIQYRKDTLYGTPFGMTDYGGSNFSQSEYEDNGKHLVDFCSPKDRKNDITSKNGSDKSQGGYKVQICRYKGAEASNAQFSEENKNCFCRFNSEDERCKPKEGCLDPSANNFDDLAIIDNGSCTYDEQNIYGCTDSSASNFDPSATVDDGTCSNYIYGCTNPSAPNYNSLASMDDGSCSFPIYGCTDASASNYNSSATVDDNTCIHDSYGCTDPSATNYNYLAYMDDGTCSYQTSGCTDSTAMNFNSAANMDDGSCSYQTSGCTDSTAMNFNSAANMDDGSCSY